MKNKVAIVTGGSSGIGKAASMAMVKEGAIVIICARNLQRLASATLEIKAATGIQVTSIQIDVTKPSAKRLNFRFDIMDEFPYHIPHQQISIDVNKEYLKVMLDRKESKDVMKPEAYIGEGKLSFLNETDDLVIRFLEWAWQPHKLRHIKRFRNDFDFHKHGEEFISIIDKYTNLDMDENYIDMLFTDLKNRGI